MKKNHQHDEPVQEQAPADVPPAAPAETPAAVPAVDETAVLKERLLRLQADFDNFRKRTAKERAELFQRANEDIMEELLPVLDHFELGLSTAAKQPEAKAVHDGFQMVYDQLQNVVKKFGLVPLDVQSSTFDPHVHEALAHLPSPEHAADEIISQTRRGYKLGEKVLRPIQVVVSSGPGAPRDDEVKNGGESTQTGA